MRISIEKGFHAPIEKLMQQLQTDDPKLAVHHIIGCWIASQNCPALSAVAPSDSRPSPINEADEFADILDWK